MSWFGDKALITAQSDLIAAQAQGRLASNEAISSAKENLRIAKEDLRKAKERASKSEKLLKTAQEENQQWKEAIAERDAIILEWMQSNEAFKRLARQYGKQVGATDEQRQIDLDNHLLDVAEEDPDFANTKRTQGAKQRLGK